MERKIGEKSYLNEKLNVYGDFWLWVDIDGNLYYPDCYEYDEETNEYKPKKR